MKSFLIVEDEDVERDYLCSSAAKILPGCQIVSACNGADGLRLFREYHPEIVLTDIYMPVMDGLELIEQIKAEDPQVLCYILTSYDYFDYAQRAIHLGVEDFVLKPINKKGFARLLSSASAILEKRSSQDQLSDRIHALECKIEKDCFVCAVMAADEKQLIENLRLLGLSGSEQVICMAGRFQNLEASANALRAMGMTCISGEFEEAGILFLFSTGYFWPEQKPAIEQLIQSEPGVRYGMAANASEAIRICQALRHQLQPGRQAGTELIEKDLIFELALLLLDQAEGKSTDIQKQSCLLGQLCHVPAAELFEQLAACSRELIIRRYGVQTVHEIQLSPYLSIEKGMEQIVSLLSHSLRICCQSVNAHKYREAVSYVELNFDRPISLRDVAMQLNVSIYYLSRLLNQNSQNSFSDLLHLYRIEEAKRLIRQGVSFKQVAWRVGYSSQSYFSRNFKQFAGVSPTVYKEMADSFYAAA